MHVHMKNRENCFNREHKSAMASHFLKARYASNSNDNLDTQTMI